MSTDDPRSARVPELPTRARGEHQNIARAALVLEALADSGIDGLRLTDVIANTGLTKTVAHRLLSGLVSHGLASVDKSASRYFLGDRIITWAARAGERFELAERITPYLQELANELEDTIYFMQRRGNDAICLGRAEGDFPVKTLTLAVGDRRPLGAGSGSLAILAFLDDDEVERAITDSKDDLHAYRLTPDSLRAAVEATRTRGYALNVNTIIPGMTGVGVPLRARGAVPVGALNAVAISPRLEGERRGRVADLLTRTARHIESDLDTIIEYSMRAPFWRAR